jgi:hypothetical protein
MLFDLTFPCYLTTFSGKKCLSGKVVCFFFCPAYRKFPVQVGEEETRCFWRWFHRINNNIYNIYKKNSDGSYLQQPKTRGEGEEREGRVLKIRSHESAATTQTARLWVGTPTISDSVGRIDRRMHHFKCSTNPRSYFVRCKTRGWFLERAQQWSMKEAIHDTED